LIARDGAAAGPARFAAPMIALHWITVALLVAVYTCIELRELFPRGSEPRELLKVLHYSLGLSVLALTVLRLMARAALPTPPVRPPLARWQQHLSAATHTALYLLMLTLPALGWLMLNADGKTAQLFSIELPVLLAPDEPLAEILEEVHETLGSAGYFIIALHAAAALAHHYWWRDNTLVRMLPAGPATLPRTATDRSPVR
jgi:superoxide oxidase